MFWESWLKDSNLVIAVLMSSPFQDAVATLLEVVHQDALHGVQDLSLGQGRALGLPAGHALLERHRPETPLLLGA